MNIYDYLSIVAVFTSVLAIVVALLRNAWLARSMRLNAAIDVFRWLEKVRGDRLTLYKAREEETSFNDWSTEVENAARRVTRRFDMLGLYDSLDYTDRRMVDRFYAIPAFEIWEICEPWIRQERKNRGPQHLWEFEQFAKRVKHVKSNHPAITGRRKWPRDPRRSSS